MKIAIDFDGVLHWYRPHTRGLGAHVIADEPVPGAIEWFNGLRAAGHELTVFTCRLVPWDAMAYTAITDWLIDHGVGVIGIACDGRNLLDVRVQGTKPHADVYIDDRGFRFEGRFPSIEELEALAVPWNGRSET